MGYLGDEFNELEPADSSQVKQGASWIRDIKARIKGFAGRLFDLDTGEYLDGVIPSDALQDQFPPGSPILPNTWYGKVKVNRKGLVTDATLEDAQGAVAFYRATFRVTVDGGTSYTDLVNETIRVDSGDLAVYTSSQRGPFESSSTTLNNSTYADFSWTVPKGVYRIRATVVGAGGGSYVTTPSVPSSVTHSGAGGEHAEACIPVTPESPISIAVGLAGAEGGGVSPAVAGGPSIVKAGSAYIEAAGGGGATVASDGAVVAFGPSIAAADFALVRCAGTAGSTTTAGESGSYLRGFGGGGGISEFSGVPRTSESGIVILEWVA